MSTATLPTFRESLVVQLRSAGETYLRDLGHLSADKLGVSPGGAARSALLFTAEVASFNMLIAQLIRGESPALPSAEERAAYEATVTDHASAQGAVTASVDALVAAIEGADDTQLASEITAPWGSKIVLYRLAIIAVQHMAYHDGQINYIQTLFGDTEEHWG